MKVIGYIRVSTQGKARDGYILDYQVTAPIPTFSTSCLFDDKGFFYFYLFVSP